MPTSVLVLDLRYHRLEFVVALDISSGELGPELWDFDGRRIAAQTVVLGVRRRIVEEAVDRARAAVLRPRTDHEVAATVASSFRHNASYNGSICSMIHFLVNDF